MKKFLLPVLAILALAGCYPSSPTYTEQYDLVVTDRSPDYDFTTKHTYARPDSIVVVTGEYLSGTGNGQLSYVTPVVATQIFSAIDNNMATYGWTKVDKSQNPDVLLFPAAMQNTFTYYYYYYDYWNWWYGGYYGWYYPGYYPGYVSSYTTGTLLVSMVDINAITPDNQLPAEWTMVVNGLMTGNTSSVTTRITSTINQAFAQSTYLSH